MKIIIKKKKWIDCFRLEKTRDITTKCSVCVVLDWILDQQKKKKSYKHYWYSWKDVER